MNVDLTNNTEEIIIGNTGRVSVLRFPADRILRRFIQNKNRWRIKKVFFLATDEGLVKIRTNSQRYRLFRENKTCVRCGKVGLIMSLDRYITELDKTTFRFNLYCLEQDGSLTLMTKDHILPKSKGGTNTLDNYQTMCVDCNSKKGNTIEEKKEDKTEAEVLAY